MSSTRFEIKNITIIFSIMKKITKSLSKVQLEAYCYDTCFIVSQSSLAFILVFFQHEQIFKYCHLAQFAER